MGACLASLCCECTTCLTCCACQGVCNFTLSRAAKFGHILVAIVLFITAELFGRVFYTVVDDIPGLNLKGDCASDYEGNCVTEQLIYRASATLLCIFFFLGLLTPRFPPLHTGWWLFKFLAAFGIFWGFWWGENKYFSDYANFARITALVWLLVQNLLILDAAHDMHENISQKMADDDSPETEGGGGWRFMYVSLGGLSVIGSIVCVGLMYAHYGSCSLNLLLISITLIAGILLTAASLLDSVNVGLLPPGLLFAYSTFLCWYALISQDSTVCNPEASDLDSGAYIVSQIISISAVILMLWWCSWNQAGFVKAITGQGPPKKEKSEDEKMQAILGGDSLAEGNRQLEEGAPISPPGSPPPGSPPPGSRPGSPPPRRHHDDVGGGPEMEMELPNEPSDQRDRAVFHFLLCFGSVFMAMALTNWGNTNGSPVSYGSGWESTTSFWMKVVCQWTLLLMQIRVIHLNYQENAAENDPYQRRR